jgi:uncharacterized protein YdaT
MKNLPPRVRRKAIEIANALLKEGYDEGRCIRIAIWRARRWGGSGENRNRRAPGRRA